MLKQIRGWVGVVGSALTLVKQWILVRSPCRRSEIASSNTINSRGSLEVSNHVDANATSMHWQQFNQGSPIVSVVEAKLYSDAWLIGELKGVGPFDFINNVAVPLTDNAPRPAIVLRVRIHSKSASSPYENVEWPDKDNSAHYHGGDFIDEMAALVSLFLGIRVKAGPIDRLFIPHGDPYGEPKQYGCKPIPDQLTPIASKQIPRSNGEHNLMDLSVIDGFSNRTVDDANALVKAARIYQQAIWIADSDPALAWLLLVSAVETVAARWAQDDISARDKLEAAMPELFKLIRESECPNLIEQIAEHLATYTRPTAKFINFLKQFVPPPPERRTKRVLAVSVHKEKTRRSFQHCIRPSLQKSS